MKTSVSSYSFSQYIRSGKMSQLDCIAKAKEIGFEAIEFTDLDGENLEAQKAYAAQIREEADRIGIEIAAYTIGACLYKDNQSEMDAEVERLKGQVEVAAILGAKVMRHDVCYQLGKKGDARSFDMMLPHIADSARQITEYAQSLGVKTCTENHGYIAQDSDRVERLFNAVHHDNYGLLVDMGNFVCADEDPQRAVSRVAPYAVHVHVKDMLYRSEPVGEGWGMTRACNYFKGTVVGEGDVPVKKCLQILKRAGYDGYCSIEFEAAGDCVDGITRGLANLQKMIAQLD